MKKPNKPEDKTKMKLEEAANGKEVAENWSTKKAESPEYEEGPKKKKEEVANKQDKAGNENKPTENEVKEPEQNKVKGVKRPKKTKPISVKS